MYQQFRDKVLAQLSSLDAGTLQKVSKALDKVGNEYEFSRKETALIPAYENGLPDPAKYYLVSRKMEGLSTGSLKLYKLYLEIFFRSCFKPLDKITANDIRVFLYTYQEEHGISNRTLNTMRSVISAFFSWAASEEYISSDPCRTIKVIKYEAKHRDALTQMELEQIRKACRDEREIALIEVLYSTGCRASEIAHAKLSEIDWNSRELVVLGKGNKHRTVYLNAKAIVALKAYNLKRSDSTDAIFVSDREPHTALTVSGIERIIKLIMGRCPDVSKRVSPHVFRHTTATVAIQSGMPVQDVQRVLGHSQINTTMIYAEVSQTDVKSEHTKFVV